MYNEAQQPAGEQVDSLLQEEFQRRHLAQHDRPHLEECTEEEFEADLCDFLRQNQESTLAKAVADHRITWYLPFTHCVNLSAASWPFLPELSAQLRDRSSDCLCIFLHQQPDTTL